MSIVVSAEKPDGPSVQLHLELDSVMLDGKGAAPDWLPPDWQDELGTRLHKLTEVDVNTITGAIALGWRVVGILGEDDTITIVSPDESTRFHFAPGRKQRKDRIRKTVMRLGVPERVLELQEADGDVWKMYEDNPERIVPIELIRPEQPEPEPSDEPYLIETRPMLAKQHQGRGYQSKIAIERTWSDGSTDYKCMLCDFTRTNRLSMRGHWQKHIRSGEAKAVGGPGPGETFQTDVPNAASYAPRQHRIDALADLLAKLLEDETLDPAELALAALTWVHEQTKHGTGLAAEHEELTDTERLHRIRLLLGMPDPQIVAQLTEENDRLREQVAAAERFAEQAVADSEEWTRQTEEYGDQIVGHLATIESLEVDKKNLAAERDWFQGKAARAQGDLQTLRELVQGLGNDDEEGPR